MAVSISRYLSSEINFFRKKTAVSTPRSHQGLPKNPGVIFHEKKLLTKHGNVIIADERIKALSIAQKKYKMAILDDGLQQKNIKYDLKIVCFNSTETIGNNFILPAGPLREKFSEIKTYDLVFIIGDNPDRKFINKIKTIKKNSNIFFANYSVSNLSKFNLKKKYLIFSGIGNPHEFENTLLKSKFKIVTIEFVFST